MSWVGLVFWAGSLCQDCPTTFRFFIKSLEEGRLVRPKHRETSSRFCLCCFVIYVYIFVLDETAGFGCRHFIYKGYLKIWNQHVATLGWKPPLQSETTRLMESNLALWIRIRIILKTESCFLLCHKVMLSFAPVHMKTLKRWKYDSIPNRVGACVNARSIWCDIMHRSWKSSFSSVHTQTKSRGFQKSPLWGRFFKNCFFGARKRRLRGKGRLQRRKKSPSTQHYHRYPKFKSDNRCRVTKIL